MGVLPETLIVFYNILKQSTPSHWTSKSLTYLLGSLRNWPRIKRLIKRRLGGFGCFFCFHCLYNVFYIFNRIYLCPEFFVIFSKRGTSVFCFCIEVNTIWHEIIFWEIDRQLKEENTWQLVGESPVNSAGSRTLLCHVAFYFLPKKVKRS